MSKDMTNDLLNAVVAHADGQIEKHKVNRCFLHNIKWEGEVRGSCKKSFLNNWFI